MSDFDPKYCGCGGVAILHEENGRERAKCSKIQCLASTPWYGDEAEAEAAWVQAFSRDGQRPSPTRDSCGARGA